MFLVRNSIQQQKLNKMKQKCDIAIENCSVCVIRRLALKILFLFTSLHFLATLQTRKFLIAPSKRQFAYIQNTDLIEAL